MILLELEKVQNTCHDGAVGAERLIDGVDRAFVEVAAGALSSAKSAAESDNLAWANLETIVDGRRSGELDPDVPLRLVLHRSIAAPDGGGQGHLGSGGDGEVCFGRDGYCHRASLARHFFLSGGTH